MRLMRMEDGIRNSNESRFGRITGRETIQTEVHTYHGCTPYKYVSIGHGNATSNNGKLLARGGKEIMCRTGHFQESLDYCYQ